MPLDFEKNILRNMHPVALEARGLTQNMSEFPRVGLRGRLNCVQEDKHPQPGMSTPF
jgi:hypothetical protein